MLDIGETVKRSDSKAKANQQKNSQKFSKQIIRKESNPDIRQCRIQAKNYQRKQRMTFCNVEATIKREDVTVINIHTTNNIKTTFMKQKMEGETDEMH